LSRAKNSIKVSQTIYVTITEVVTIAADSETSCC